MTDALQQAIDALKHAAGLIAIHCGPDDDIANVVLDQCKQAAALLRTLAESAAVGAEPVPDPELRHLCADLDDYLRHVIDMAKGEHYLDVVRLNAESLLKRIHSVLGAGDKAAEPKPLYTAPPRLKPLSDERIKELDCITLVREDYEVFSVNENSVLEFARAILAAAGEP